MKKIIIGSHVSLKSPEYFLGSVKEAQSYHSTSLMVYTGAPQNSLRTPIEKLKITEAHQLIKEDETLNINDFICHAPYLINLANLEKEGLFERSVDMLVNEIQRTNALGLKTIVLHPGSHVKTERQAGLNSIIKGINLAFERTMKCDVSVSLELMSGKGTEIGITFEEIKELIAGIEQKEKIKVCLDTCHLWESGYDIVDKYEEVIQDFDNIVGIKYLSVIHINDSKNQKGARKDRHENIGKGYIGFDTIKKFVDDKRFESIPKILETPYIDKKPPYKEEIANLTK